MVADVTLLPDGTLAEAAIKEGDSPWAEAMLQTLRTWRFGSDPEAPPVSFQVRAQFQPGPPPKVDLRLSGLRAGERPPASTATAQASPAPAPSPAAVAPSPVAAVPSPAAAVPTAAVPSPPLPSPAATGTVAPPRSVPLPVAAPPASPASGAPPATSSPAPRPAAVPSAAPPATAVPSTATPSTPAPLPGPPAPPRAAPTPPPVEVIPGGSPAPGAVAPGVAPTPAPRAEAGISAVRDVNLGPGVPDLTKGRRPVAPPFARMSSSSGTVQVQFSVDAGGGTSIQSVSGPDLLKEAARQAVTSWAFRRTSPERLYLVAVFTYEGDKAQVEVKRAE